MDKKNFTFIVVSNRKGTTHKLTISSAWMKTLMTSAVVLMVVGAAGIVDYVGLLSQAIENRRLRTENSQLKEQFKIVEGKLNSLESGLERVRGVIAKLKEITKLDGDRSLNLAMGPLPRTGPTSETRAGREIASLPTAGVMNQDAPFYQEQPVDETQGELTVEGQRDYASLAVRIDQAIGETFLREQGALELHNALKDRQDLLAATPSIRPVRGWFTSRFGYRVSPFTGRPVMHNGLDVGATPGAPIYAPADGVVSYAGYDPGYGKLVSIDHGYGVITRFGHTSQVYVELGQKIKRGTVIAAVGNTGRSTGPHLHYEVRVNSVPVDPINYILDEY